MKLQNELKFIQPGHITNKLGYTTKIEIRWKGGIVKNNASFYIVKLLIRGYIMLLEVIKGI